jgi:hypothetical protein
MATPQMIDLGADAIFTPPLQNIRNTPVVAWSSSQLESHHTYIMNMCLEGAMVPGIILKYPSHWRLCNVRVVGDP